MSETIETAGVPPAAAPPAGQTQGAAPATTARSPDGKFAPKSAASGTPALEPPQAEIGSAASLDATLQDGKSLLGETAAEPAPASYGDFQLPEGLPVDEERMGAFKALAGEARLSQEQAQKFLDAAAQHTQALLAQAQHARVQQAEQMVAAVRADQEIGGPLLKQNLQVAAIAMEKFGTAELRQALDMTGAGNHPEVVRFFYRLGKAVSESAFVPSGAAAQSPKTRAEILYPSMAKTY